MQESPNNDSNENPIDKETTVEKEKWFNRILKANLKRYLEVQLDESDEIQSVQIVLGKKEECIATGIMSGI